MTAYNADDMDPLTPSKHIHISKTGDSHCIECGEPLPINPSNDKLNKARIDELRKVWAGMNKAVIIRDGGYTNRDLTLDDLSYYLHNRQRVLSGKKAHTPQEWLEDVR